jgi:hypothetical protein
MTKTPESNESGDKNGKSDKEDQFPKISPSLFLDNLILPPGFKFTFGPVKSLDLPISDLTMPRSSLKPSLSSLGRDRDFDYRLIPEQVSERAIAELNAITETLRLRNGKTITGEEFPTNAGEVYRGDMLGVLIATIYTHNSAVFQSPWGGTSIFADSNYRAAVQYANARASSERVCSEFEENLGKRGFVIPAAGAILLAFRDEGFGMGVDRSQHGVRSYGAVTVQSLTESCKEYVLSELGLCEDSYAFEKMYPSK